MTQTYSIVIPAYNESARIRPTLHALLRHIQEQGWDAEILVVNDGSTDDTRTSCASMARSIRKFY